MSTPGSRGARPVVEAIRKQDKPGPGQILEIWGPGNPEIWAPKNRKMEILKIQIRSAQNVGNVWIRRKKHLLTLFQILSGIFPMDWKKRENCVLLMYNNYIFFGGPLGRPWCSPPWLAYWDC